MIGRLLVTFAGAATIVGLLAVVGAHHVNGNRLVYAAAMWAMAAVAGAAAWALDRRSVQ